MHDSRLAGETSAESASGLEQVLERADLVFDTGTIEQAIEALADRLRARLGESAPLILCVMQGGLMFTGKLMPLLPLEAEFDYIHATRYNDDTQGDVLEWLAYPKKNLANRTVLILDDILDEGLTLAAIEQYCRDQGAKEVISAVLLQKKHARLAAGISCEFVALEVEDRYVFGYGMDYKGKLRHLEQIYALSD